MYECHKRLVAFRKIARIIVMLPFGSLCVSAQRADDLHQELQQLKQQYEETTRALQMRIAALEQQIEKEKEARGKPKEGTISVAEVAAEGAIQGGVLGE